MVDFYDVSPPEIKECPENCPYCPESRDYRNCPELECIYDIDEDTLGDIKYHRLVDEGKIR